MTYTNNELRERLKARIKAGSKGGDSGQWSARKAQMLAKAYKEKGGRYTGSKTEGQKSLKRWGDQDWMTKEEYENNKK
jgi:hypothetical protein